MDHLSGEQNLAHLYLSDLKKYQDPQVCRLRGSYLDSEESVLHNENYAQPVLIFRLLFDFRER